MSDIYYYGNQPMLKYKSGDIPCAIPIDKAAADLIESLQAEVERYRDALRAIRDENFIDLSNTGFPQAPMMRKYAREALKQEGAK